MFGYATMRSQILCSSKVKWNNEIIGSQGGIYLSAAQAETDDEESHFQIGDTLFWIGEYHATQTNWKI